MIELRPYVIRQGDYLARLAHLYRFDAEQVWHLPENTALRDKRGSPDILYPGDILHIPVTAACGVAVRAQSQQSYSAAVPCIDVTLTIHEAGTPLPGAICEVSGLPGRGAEVPAQYLTDAHGIVVLSVPVVLREIEIYVAAQHTTYRIQIGNLDPVDEVMDVTIDCTIWATWMKTMAWKVNPLTRFRSSTTCSPSCQMPLPHFRSTTA